MKKLLTLVIIFLITQTVIGQNVVDRSSNVVTVADSRWEAKLNMFIPRYNDTTAANLQKGIDSCGALIYTYDYNGFWYRQCSPKKWMQIPKTGSSATDSAAVLRNVTDIASLSRTDINMISVIDTLRGGTFFRYTGSDSIDNGMIFVDANGTKWQRQTGGVDFININWYGAYAYTNYTVDMSPYFNAAVSYINKHQATYRRLYAPANYNTASDNAWYLLKQTVTLRGITLFGDGAEKQPFTLFQIWPHTKAFSLPAFDIYGSPNSVNVSNIKVRHYYDDIPGDSNSHSFDIHCFVNFDNVYAMENSQGNGFNINACAGDSPSDSTYGNADQSFFRTCKANLCINGFYFNGCDANVINLTNCDASVNKRWGVYDNGMLGNRYYNFHFAGNGNQTNTGCIYGGRYYYPVDGLDNTGKSPLLYPSYWYEVEPIGYVTTWDTTKRYWSGGTAIVVNVNAWTMFHGCYIESSQPPLILNNRSTFVEGTPGSSVYYGVWERTLNGTKIFLNSQYAFKAGVQMDRLSVNQSPDGNYQASVTGSTYQVLQLISPITLTTLSMQNSAAAGQGGMAYYNDQLLLTAAGSYRTQLDATGFYPWDNNSIDLGRQSYKWKNIYAALTADPGSKVVRYDPVTGKFTYWDSTAVASNYWTLASGNIYNNTGTNVGIGLSTGIDSNFTVANGAWLKRGLRASNLPSGPGVQMLRVGSDGTFYTTDTLPNFLIGNASHYLPDSLLISPSDNVIKALSLMAGSGVTLERMGDTAIRIAASGGMAIGSLVTGGTATRVTFIGTNGLLQQNEYFTLDSANAYLRLGTTTGTATLNLGTQGGGNTGFEMQNSQTWGFASTVAGNAAIYENGGNTPFLIENAAADNSIHITTTNVGIRTGTPSSTLYVDGSFGAAYTAQTTTYAITSTDFIINCTTGTFTATLPTAVGITGRIYTIKNSGTGAITVATTSSQTIDGSTTYSLASQYKFVSVSSNGANWIVISNN